MGIITESVIYDLLGLLTAIIVVVIAYFKWQFTYWDKVGIPTLSPSIPFGDTKRLVLGRVNFGKQFEEIYAALKSRNLRHGGVYLGPKPFYFPVDLEIIKHIVQIDFQHFVNHGGFVNEQNDPLSGHLFNLEDTKWRNMRVKLTPTFTSGKMKMMFHTMADCAVELRTIIDESATNKTLVDIRDILSRFGTDIIGSVAFGLDCNSLKDPDAVFRQYGKKIFSLGVWDNLKLILQVAVPPKILNALKFKLTNREVEEFFMKVIRDTVEYREKNNIYRKDFMHLLLQLKNRGSVEDDEKVTNEEGKITINELAAQAFGFFLGGFESSSTTVSFALYEVAANPDVQEKLRQEIRTVLAKHEDKLTYDGVMEMTYMEKVLNETLRKYPPLPFLPRLCTKDYTIPNTSIVLKKGTGVAISVVGIHYDPEYYPDPEKFDPERFSEESKNSRPVFTWLPFGEGPRMCIGLRFGVLQSKVGIASLLKDYKVTINGRTKLPLKLFSRSFGPVVEGGMWLDFEKIN